MKFYVAGFLAMVPAHATELNWYILSPDRTTCKHTVTVAALVSTPKAWEDALIETNQFKHSTVMIAYNGDPIMVIVESTTAAIVFIASKNLCLRFLR